MFKKIIDFIKNYYQLYILLFIAFVFAQFIIKKFTGEEVAILNLIPKSLLYAFCLLIGMTFKRNKK